MLTHAPWTAVAGLRHGFLDGTESATTGSDWTPVLTARGIALPIAVPRQVHGVRVLVADAATRPEADGLSVAQPGLLTGVVTADCMPVLVVDRTRRAAAAVHAGWRGAAAGVLEAAVAHLGVAHGSEPGDLEAVIGPAVGGCCYEVGFEVRDGFVARTGATTAGAWEMRGSRWHVDLRAAARALLLAAGVRDVAVAGPCTACGGGYHSYRRDGTRTGRQLSFVGWAPPR